MWGTIKENGKTFLSFKTFNGFGGTCNDIELPNEKGSIYKKVN